MPGSQAGASHVWTLSPPPKFSVEGTYVTAVDLEAKRKEISFRSSEAESLDMWGKLAWNKGSRGGLRKASKKEKH